MSSKQTSGGRACQAERQTRAKAPEQGCVWHVGGPARRQGCLKHAEQDSITGIGNRALDHVGPCLPQWDFVLFWDKVRWCDLHIKWSVWPMCWEETVGSKGGGSHTGEGVIQVRVSYRWQDGGGSDKAGTMEEVRSGQFLDIIWKEKQLDKGCEESRMTPGFSA